MSQLLRGIGSRKAQSLTSFLLVAVTVAGSLVAARFSDLTGTPAGTTGVLLLLGVVALSVHAAGCARSRRSEIALAQLRGRGGLRLFGYFLAEPMMLLSAGAIAGVLLGRQVTEWAAQRWLVDAVSAPSGIGRQGWVTVAIAVGACFASVVSGSWRTVREPLLVQLDAGLRPRPTAGAGLFGQTLVIVAAGVAGFQASQHAVSRSGWAGVANPALLSPILIGLAAGQVAAWGLRGLATLTTRRTARKVHLGLFLAVRRLARRSDTVLGTRLVIAAAVVTAVTTSATAAVAAWQDESTRLALGGPRQFTVSSGALAAYEVTQRADPTGHWLMAMVAAPDGSAPYRRMFADTQRWSAVVGDFLAGTGAAGVSDNLAALAAGKPVAPARGNILSVSFDNQSLRRVHHPKVAVFYTKPSGSVGAVSVKPPAPSGKAARPTRRGAHPQSTTVTRAVTGCRDGCTVTQIVVEGVSGRPASSPSLVLTGIDFAGQSLLDRSTWSPAAADLHPGHVQQSEGILQVAATRYGAPTSLTSSQAKQSLAAVVTPGLAVGHEGVHPIGYAVDGGLHRIDPVATTASLPFVGRQGMLMDLPRAMGGGGTIPAATALIVARADTPQSILAALEGTGKVSRPRDFASSVDAARRRADVQGVRVYTLLSVFAAMIAVIGITASAGAQRSERRREAASLRVTGVRSRYIRAAYRAEALWLAVCAAAMVAVTGWLAARLTLAGLDVVPQTSYSPLLQGDPNLPTLLVVAAFAGLLVGVVTLAANDRIARLSPPSTLRDEIG